MTDLVPLPLFGSQHTCLDMNERGPRREARAAIVQSSVGQREAGIGYSELTNDWKGKPLPGQSVWPRRTSQCG
jgi:hypothetical protein